MDEIFFKDWSSILRILIIGILAYAFLLIMLRTFGKRILAKMDAFDFIVTVALGSTLSSVILTKEVSMADGILGLTLLILLQFIISKLSLNSKIVNQFIRAVPTLLFYEGEYIYKAMEEERITKEEIMAKIRQQGFSSTKEIKAVVLETDGKMSIINISGSNDTSTMENVKYFKNRPDALH